MSLHTRFLDGLESTSNAPFQSASQKQLLAQRLRFRPLMEVLSSGFHLELRTDRFFECEEGERPRYSGLARAGTSWLKFASSCRELAMKDQKRSYGSLRV